MKYYLAVLGLTFVLAACSDADDTSGSSSDMAQLTIDVTETGWHGETINVNTRAGETLEGLKATTGDVATGYGYGFGIYCSELNYTNTQVTWDNINSKWLIDEHNYNTYWQRNEPGTINVYAYAPYNTVGYTVDESNKLTFIAQKHSYKHVDDGEIIKDYTNQLSGGNVDLLQANASISRSSNQPAQLTFNHKLAKLTFGTITNNTGETIQLNGYTVKGTLNSEANLDLTNGKWESHTNSVLEIQLPPPFVYVVHTAAELDGDPPAGYAAKALIEPLLDKQTTLPNMTMGSSLLLIPNADGKIDVTVEVNNSTGEKFSFPITLEEGKEKIVNITIGRNFEVVITE